MTTPHIALTPSQEADVLTVSPTTSRLSGHVRDRSGSATSISLAAALAAGTTSPPRPMSPTLLSPPLRQYSPNPQSHHQRPSISVPRSKRKSEDEKTIDGNAAPPPEDATVLRQAAHYSSLVLAAMLGTLIRLGLEAMGRYDGAIIFPLAWAQGVGCGIMGIAAARKNQIYWWYPPFHTFLGTGIAGSVTTFSSWMLEGFLAFSNFEGFNRGGFYDSVDGVAYSLATLAISVACLYLGYHFSSIFPNLPARTVSPKRTPFSDCIMLLSAILSYLAALLLYFLAPKSWRYRVTFSLLLAPPGAMLRYLLSRLNTLRPVSGKFPLGTFLANMIATMIIAGVYAAQHRPPSYNLPLRCDGLHALQEGFCGCLSTVSTFAVEITTIKLKRWRWIYLWVSVVFGHVFVLAVLGGVKWSDGIGAPCRGSDL